MLGLLCLISSIVSLTIFVLRFIYHFTFHLIITSNDINFLLLITVLAYISPLLVAFVHFIPDLLDLVAPLNQSRPHQLLVLSEYFVNNDEYFYLILLHMIVCLFILLSILISTTSIYVAYIQHVCGMFEIAR